MFGQFAFEGVAVDDEPGNAEPGDAERGDAERGDAGPAEVEPELDVVDGVFVVVLVAAWAATPPPRMRAPVTAVAAMAFRMGCM
jgi:hypothetical protein